MRRAAIAQALIALVTTQDRAAAVVGDLLEQESCGVRGWFWWTVAGTTVAFAWLNIVRFIFRRHSQLGAHNGGQVMDFWRFVWRRKWLLMIPVVVFMTATSLVAYSMPVRYRAEARLMVEPPRVPESFVPASSNTQLEDRLDLNQRKVLNRTRLERIIKKFNLYEEERKTGLIDDVIQRMRDQDIGLGALPSGREGEPAVFTVSFRSTEAKIAMRVTEELASVFIVENLVDRSSRATNTTMFLEGQIDALAQEVDAFASRMEQDRIKQRTSPRSQVLEYEELQNTYRAMLAKRQQARIAANMEQRQIGEQFRILDPVRMPMRPEGPERLSISLFGAGAGLAVGLLLMLVAPMRRPTPPAPPLVPAAAPVAE